jgi:hypothetical protein
VKELQCCGLGFSGRPCELLEGSRQVEVAGQVHCGLQVPPVTGVDGQMLPLNNVKLFITGDQG